MSCICFISIRNLSINMFKELVMICLVNRALSGRDLTIDQYDLQYHLLIPIFILSFGSCAYIVGLFIRNRNIDYEGQLICGLMIFDSLLNLVNIFPGVYSGYENLCFAQGALIQIFSLSGIIWTGLISTVFLINCKSGRPVEISIIGAFIVVLVCTALTAFIPMIKDGIGLYVPTGSWCWYPKAFVGERFGGFYGIVWAIILWNCIACYWSYKLYNQNRRENRYFKKLIYYPIILFICYTPLTISRILENSLETIPIAYSIWSSIIIRMLGFCNAIAYGVVNYQQATPFPSYPSAQ